MEKLKVLIAQILKFGLVGGIAFVIDYGLLIVLTEWAGVNYMISSAVSFSVSVIFNYLMSVFWVFDVKNDRGRGQSFIVFMVLSIIGLGLNQLLMWIGSDLLRIYYLLTKIGATAIVMVYNFITRKLFLEGK